MDAQHNPASDTTYAVVVNDEGQHSVWPVDRSRPAGWSGNGFVGSYDACLDHIELVWTDMRPVSAR